MVLEAKRVVYGDDKGELKIPARSGEAHRLIDVFISRPQISHGDYMEVKVGTTGITRIPLRTANYFLVNDPERWYQGTSIFKFIRNVFGEDVYVEADEDEDIFITVFQWDGKRRDILNTAVAVYEVIPTGIDKTKLMRSGCDNFIIAPYISRHETRTGDNATVDGTWAFDKVSQMEGLPLIIDKYTVPSGVRLVTKAIITDHMASSTGTLTYPTLCHIFIRDRTFTLFSPVDMFGLRVNRRVAGVPSQNLGAFSLETGYYLSGEDYAFESGHEIGLSAYMRVAATGTGITTHSTAELIMFMLMETGGT